MWFSLKSAARAASKNRSCVHGAVEPTLLSSRERRRRTILRSFQEIFSSLILKMSGLTLRGRRVCEDLHSVKLRGVKLESLLRFIFTCSGSRSLHLSNHKNCLLNKNQYFWCHGRNLFLLLYGSFGLPCEAWWITIIPLFCKSNYFIEKVYFWDVVWKYSDSLRRVWFVLWSRFWGGGVGSRLLRVQDNSSVAHRRPGGAQLNRDHSKVFFGWKM